MKMAMPLELLVLRGVQGISSCSPRLKSCRLTRATTTPFTGLSRWSFTAT